MVKKKEGGGKFTLNCQVSVGFWAACRCPSNILLLKSLLLKIEIKVRNKWKNEEEEEEETRARSPHFSIFIFSLISQFFSSHRNKFVIIISFSIFWKNNNKHYSIFFFLNIYVLTHINYLLIKCALLCVLFSFTHIFYNVIINI